MFPIALNTNEVKNTAGVEVEFAQRDSTGRMVEFAKVGEVPSAPHRIVCKHEESGSGLKLSRRSLLRVDYNLTSQVDGITRVPCSAYAVAVVPMGHLTDFSGPSMALANLMSLLASTGATTTILYDGTGYGASALINGTL